MRFRKNFRRRTRRPGANMIPMSICGNGYLSTAGSACSGGFAQLFLLDGLQGEETGTTAATGLTVSDRLLQQTERKSLLIQSLRFHWGVTQASYPDGLNVQYQLATRAAILRVEVDSFGAPGEFPNLFSKFDNVVGDVLWRGAGIVKGANDLSCDGEVTCRDSFTGSGNINSGVGTMWWAGSLPVHVKAKRRLGPRQALFFAVQTHNPLTGPGNDIDMALELFGVAAVRSSQR